MKKYSSYKDSGVEWIGETPSQWTNARLRFLCDITTGGKDTVNAVDDGKYPFFVRSKKIKRINSFSFDGEGILTAGDGDICKIWHHIIGKFDFHQRVYLLYNFKNVIGKFLYYYLTENFIHEVLKLSAKSTVDSLRLPMFLDFPLAIPPLSEQQKIVEFLDSKTSNIDRLLEQKKNKIEFLKEKRTSLINHVVTKGLNPDVQMKDSGVDWIGEIPEHWEMKPIRYLGIFQNGISKGSEFFGKGYPFMNYGDVYKNEVTPSIIEGKVQSDELDRQRYSVVRGDVFFTRTSESKDDIGIASTCIETIPNCSFSGFVIRFRFNANFHLPEYSRYHFQTHWKKVLIESKMNIVTRASLSQQVLGQVPVLIPATLEQQEIVKYLDKQSKEIDNLIQLEQKKIDLLKEYRQSLISEVVTGKVRVCEEDLSVANQIA